MTNSKESDVLNDMLWAIKKENYAYQKKQMIISCDHMLGTEVDEREYGWPVNGLHEISIRALNGMSSHR